MRNLFFLVSTIVAHNYIFDSSNGLLFQENEEIWVYDARVPVNVNIMLPSTREKFRTAFNADCGEKYLEETMTSNLFGRNDTNTTSFNETMNETASPHSKPSTTYY